MVASARTLSAVWGTSPEDISRETGKSPEGNNKSERFRKHKLCRKLRGIVFFWSREEKTEEPCDNLLHVGRLTIMRLGAYSSPWPLVLG